MLDAEPLPEPEELSESLLDPESEAEEDEDEEEFDDEPELESLDEASWNYETVYNEFMYILQAYLFLWSHFRYYSMLNAGLNGKIWKLSSDVNK